MEATLEDECCLEAELDGWTQRKLKWIGRTGAADRIFVKGGRVVFVEFKDRGEPASKRQLNERQDFLDHGAEWYVIDNFFDFSKRVLRR